MVLQMEWSTQCWWMGCRQLGEPVHGPWPKPHCGLPAWGRAAACRAQLHGPGQGLLSRALPLPLPRSWHGFLERKQSGGCRLGCGQHGTDLESHRVQGGPLDHGKA